MAYIYVNFYCIIYAPDSYTFDTPSSLAALSEKMCKVRARFPALFAIRLVPLNIPAGKGLGTN